MKKTTWLILVAGTVVAGYGSYANAMGMQNPAGATALAAGPGSAESAGENIREVVRPSDPRDVDGWAAYLRLITQRNSQGLTQANSYLFFIPLDGENARQRQIEDFRDLAHRRIRPGNLIAFAGPDSSLAADTLVEAFRGESGDWAAGATLLFIGAPEDKERVFDALRVSGATLRFVDMQSMASVKFNGSAAPLPHFIMPPPPPPLAPPPPPLAPPPPPPLLQPPSLQR